MRRSLDEGAASPGLLTSAEVAGLLRVHPKHVYRLLRAGLPGLRVGGEWRFERDRVLAWARDRARPATPPEPDEAPVLAANDDEAVALLLAALQDDGCLAFGHVPADSGAALDLLASGRAAVAGFHRREVPAFAGSRRLARNRLVEREVGRVGRAGRRPPSLDAAAARRLASRPATAGVRSTLDAAFARAGLPAEEVDARARRLRSNRDVVSAVARGEADVGVTSRDWAERFGLPFRPLATERYDFLVLADRLADPAVLALCAAARRSDVRRALGRLPGHSAQDAGSVRIEPEGAR
jgi:excisionase family DNA binding protein